MATNKTQKWWKGRSREEKRDYLFDLDYDGRVNVFYALSESQKNEFLDIMSTAWQAWWAATEYQERMEYLMDISENQYNFIYTCLTEEQQNAFNSGVKLWKSNREESNNFEKQDESNYFDKREHELVSKYGTTNPDPSVMSDAEVMQAKNDLNLDKYTRQRALSEDLHRQRKKWDPLY